MTHELKPQLADSLLAELLPRIQAAPQDCQDDLQAALALALAIHDDALRSSAVQLGDRDADLRRLGLVWATAHHPLDPLLDLLTALTEKTLGRAGRSREAVVTEAGGQIIRAILGGFQQAYQWAPRETLASHDRRVLATTLLWDLEVAPAHQPLLAESYAVLAVRHPAQAGRELDEEQIVAHFDRAKVPGTLPFLAEPLGYILVPAQDKPHAVELAEQFRQDLPGQVSLAVAWRSRDQVPSGRQEARDIARIVAVSARPPGAYQLDDVLVEYAVMREPSAANGLVRILTPIAGQPMLLSTLKSFIAANGNRSRAAADLGIHRSTLDYRLQRIEHLTGTGPTSTAGLQLLAIALTTYTALHLDAPDQAEPA